jgi:hypothetical protein
LVSQLSISARYLPSPFGEKVRMRASKNWAADSAAPSKRDGKKWPESFRGKTVATRSELTFHPEEQRREVKVDRPLRGRCHVAAAKPLTILPRIPKGPLAAEPADASSARTDHCALNA